VATERGRSGGRVPRGGGEGERARARTPTARADDIYYDALRNYAVNTRSFGNAREKSSVSARYALRVDANKNYITRASYIRAGASYSLGEAPRPFRGLRARSHGSAAGRIASFAIIMRRCPGARRRARINSDRRGR